MTSAIQMKTETLGNANIDKYIGVTTIFSGIMGLLANDLIDMGGLSMRITPERMKVAHFTFPIRYFQVIFFVIKVATYLETHSFSKSTLSMNLTATNFAISFLPRLQRVYGYYYFRLYLVSCFKNLAPMNMCAPIGVAVVRYVIAILIERKRGYTYDIISTSAMVSDQDSR